MNLYAYAGNNPVAFVDPFGLDTVHVVGEFAEVHLAEMRRDPVGDSVYNVLNDAAEHYTIIGTEVIPDHPLSQRSTGVPGFPGKAIQGAKWDGFEEFSGFAHPNSSGSVVLGMASQAPSKYLGHEMVHMLQIHDGVGITAQSNSMDKYQQLFKHFTPWSAH